MYKKKKKIRRKKNRPSSFRANKPTNEKGKRKTWKIDRPPAPDGRRVARNLGIVTLKIGGRHTSPAKDRITPSCRTHLAAVMASLRALRSGGATCFRRVGVFP